MLVKEMSNKFYLEGVCPVCGKIHSNYNPPLSMNLNSTIAAREDARKQKHPITFYKCYHNGTPFESQVYAYSSGCKVPMHMFWWDSKNRVYPTAGDF